MTHKSGRGNIRREKGRKHNMLTKSQHLPQSAQPQIFYLFLCFGRDENENS